MIVRSPVSVLGLVVALGVGSGAVADSRFDEGREKAAQCIACHGIEGVTSNPMFPHLVGQNASYLEIQLRRFRTGERYHPLMSPVAQSLSDEDIDDLATYYSRLGRAMGAPRP